MSETTNPTPEEVLADFRDLGMSHIPSWEIPKIHIRVLTARGIYLGANNLVSVNITEFEEIEQEIANRVMGRSPLLK